MNAHQTSEVGRYRVSIIHDDDPMSPREWDNVGTLEGCANYTFSDGDASYQSVRADHGPVLALPIRAYSQSYTIVSECEWDSADGFYWASLSKIDEEGWQDVTQLRDCLRAELATLNQWLEGDVWGYVLSSEDEEHVDSCWGFFGIDDAMSEGRAAAEFLNYRDACNWAGLPEWVRQYVLAREEGEAA